MQEETMALEEALATQLVPVMPRLPGYVTYNTSSPVIAPTPDTPGSRVRANKGEGRSMKTSALSNAISITLLAAATCMTVPALAQEAAVDATKSNRTSITDSQVKTDFDLPAGQLAAALDAFGTESGLQVDYPPELVAGRQARAVHGRMSWRDALARLLEGAGLDYKVVDSKTVAIQRVAGQGSASGLPIADTAASSAPHPAPDVTDLDSVQVTGTRIRGGSTPSPVITIGSEQIEAEGFADLGEVIRSVPQNFSGGQNPGVTSSANVSGNNYNATGGSGLNLRGLGPDATLTLLNGRRMAYSGASQAVDISEIPVEAVERLEIVPDGASAIYGSDAVGGVANVILKRDFDGVAIGARYGGATNGGLTTHEYRATVGTTWSTGGLIATGMKTTNDPIYSDQRDYTTSMYRRSTLWQRNDLRSGLLSLHQSVGDTVDLHLEVLRADRRILMDTGYAGLYYRDTPATKTTLVSPAVEWMLANNWLVTVSAAFGRDKTYTHQQVINTASGALATNSIGTYSNNSLNYEINAEGSLFALPGGDVRLAAGVGYRYNRFVSLGISSNTTIADGDESSRFAYAELNLPLIGPEQGVRGIERLALTGAVRVENYATYGKVFTPKFGLVYSPTADFTVKTSWGRSFKSPRLLQRYSSQYALYYPQATFGGTGYPADATVLYRTGGSMDLQPERAKTWSVSFVFHPEALPGLETRLSWFDIDYTDRIVQPVVPTEALSNPIYARFVTYSPTTEALATAVKGADTFYNYVGAPYDANTVVAVVDGRYVNASRQKIKGVDLSSVYRFDVGPGQLVIRGAASWLDSSQATIATQDLHDLAGTLFNPAKLNGRFGVAWNRGKFTMSVFGNYKSGVRSTTEGTKGASFSTFDTAFIYDTGGGSSWLANMKLELTVNNLLNRAPPLYAVASLSDAPYDSTNYSAVGRFVRLSVSKRW